MTPLEIVSMQQTALHHSIKMEQAVRKDHPVLTIAYIGALLLARMALFAHSKMPKGALSARSLAQEILNEALDDAELMAMKCEGRA